MNSTFGRGLLWLCSSICLTAFGKLTPEQVEQLPPPATHEINFITEIKPIFEASCIKCHGRGRSKGDFRIDGREMVLKGGETGPAAIPGKSSESYLIELVMGFDPDNAMPKKGSRLSREQIGLLRGWIDQGMKWDQAVSFGRMEPVNLKPRRPGLLPVKDENPIDRLLEPYFLAHQVKPGPVIDDRLFARRVYLDVIGLLPPREELARFEHSKRKDKRQRLVRELLSDHQEYAAHWLTFWNDALRNDYRGTGYIDGGRKQITQWLYRALATNLPYNRFVAQLINPPPESEGFVKGIVWRGVVNASQTPPMQAAQNISQVFMGVNLKCASCHDSFINDWMLSDAYGLASIYADSPLELVHCDKPTGQQAAVKFIYPQLGDIDAKAEKAARLKQLAELICGPQDGRLTRTLVNRVWQRLMGRGLVEPIDDMEKPAWHPDLLDWLAEDFADHKYDVRHVLEQILTSRAYQLPAVNAAQEVPGDFVFRGPYVRRISAEQFRDAVFSLTGIGGTLPASGFDFNTAYAAAKPGGTPSLPHAAARAKWIWNTRHAEKKTKPTTLYFRKEIVLPAKPDNATATVSCDDSFTLYVNGEKAGSGSEFSKPALLDITSRLKAGTNLFAIMAENKAPEKKKDADTNSPPVDPATPAGLLFVGRFENQSGRGQVTYLVSNDSWLCSEKKKSDWEKADFSTEGWEKSRNLGGPNLAPWKLAKGFAACDTVAADYGEFRCSVLTADSMTTALGRPNREQVVTQRSPTATTLQALELTNGAELAKLLRRGAERILKLNPKLSGHILIHQLYLEAFGRHPTVQEFELAMGILGERPQKEGLEDLLWTLAMLPEFQLIY